MKPMRTIVLGLALGMAGGCAEPETGITDAQFVSVLAALRDAATEHSPADFEARRDAILEEAGISPDELYGFVRRATRDPRRLSAAWDSAAARVGRPDSTPADPEGGAMEPGSVEAPPAPVERGRVRRSRGDRLPVDSGVVRIDSVRPSRAPRETDG